MAPSDSLSRAHLLAAIHGADREGFAHFAAALRELYRRRYGFATVTGRDFGRAMAWARTQPSALAAHVREQRHQFTQGERLESAPGKPVALGARSADAGSP